MSLHSMKERWHPLRGTGNGILDDDWSVLNCGWGVQGRHLRDELSRHPLVVMFQMGLEDDRAGFGFMQLHAIQEIVFRPFPGVILLAGVISQTGNVITSVIPSVDEGNLLRLKLDLGSPTLRGQTTNKISVLAAV